MDKRRSGVSKGKASVLKGQVPPPHATMLRDIPPPGGPRVPPLHLHHHHGPRPPPGTPTIYVPAPTPPPPPPSVPMPKSVAPPPGSHYISLLPAPMRLHHSHVTTTAGISAASIPLYTTAMPLHHGSMGLEPNTALIRPGPVPGPNVSKVDALTRANIQDLLKEQPPQPASGLLQSGVGGPHHHVYAYHHAAQDGTVTIAAPPIGLPMGVAPPPHLCTYAVPSKDEEKKRQKRALNRQSAQRCRKRKRAMLEELQTANKLLSTDAAILESLCSTNVAFMHRTGTITFALGTSCLGFDPEELEAQDVYGLLAPGSCVRVRQLLAQLIDDWENTTNEPESGSSDQNTPTGSDDGERNANGVNGNRSHGSEGSEGSENSVFDEGTQSTAAPATNGGGVASRGVPATAITAAPVSSGGSSGGAVPVTLSSSGSSKGKGKRMMVVPSEDGGTSSPSSNSPPPSPGGTHAPGTNGKRSTSRRDKTITSRTDGSSGSNGSGQSSNQRFTSREPGSSTNSNISQLLPYGYPRVLPPSEFTYQIKNLTFMTRDGREVMGDVHGTITLDETLGKEPECIWSVCFQREADVVMPLSPAAVTVIATDNSSYTSSSDDSPQTSSSSESPTPLMTHGSSKVPMGYSGSKMLSSPPEPASSEGSMDVSNEEDSSDD